MNRIKFGVICFLFLLPCLSFAQQTINFTGKFQVIGDQLETLTDTNSNITLSEAEKATGFKKTVSQFPNLGTTKYSFWVRFRIKNNTDTKFLGIQITQAMIDYVDFNQLKNGKVIQSNLSGHRLPFHNRIINHQTYIYPLAYYRVTLPPFIFISEAANNLYCLFTPALFSKYLKMRC